MLLLLLAGSGTQPVIEPEPEPGYGTTANMQYRDPNTVPIDSNIQYRDGEVSVRASNIYHRSNDIGGPIG